MSVVQSSKVSIFQGFLKSVEKRSGLTELSIISWVSALEVCSFGRVPLYNDVMRL